MKISPFVQFLTGLIGSIIIGIFGIYTIGYSIVTVVDAYAIANWAKTVIILGGSVIVYGLMLAWYYLAVTTFKSPEQKHEK